MGFLHRIFSEKVYFITVCREKFASNLFDPFSPVISGNLKIESEKKIFDDKTSYEVNAVLCFGKL